MAVVVKVAGDGPGGRIVLPDPLDRLAEIEDHAADLIDGRTVVQRIADPVEPLLRSRP